MDNDSPHHLQVPSSMIKLKSSDGEILQVEVRVAKASLHIKEMLDDLGVDENEVIAIPKNAPKISGAILKKIFEWASHHKDDPVVTAEDAENDEEEKPTDDISIWDTQFLQVDQTALFEIIRAANFLNIKGLLDVSCKKVANMIKGMTLEEVRRAFNIQNDFSHDEEGQVEWENAWCQGIASQESHGTSVDTSVLNKNPAGSVQNVDTEVDEVVGECLQNSVILRKIFQHFSHAQLLTYSCVNKLWNYESRSVIKMRGNLMERLSCSESNSCEEDFEAFGLVLREMNVVPHSGVIIEINAGSHTGRPESLKSTYEAIRARLALKHLSVKLVGKWWKYKKCSAFLLAKKLLQDFSGDLEQLTFNVEDKRAAFVQQVVRHGIFPRLKILKLEETTSTSDEAYTNYIKALVPLAPNLKELHIEGEIKLTENVLDGCSALLVYKPIVRYPFDGISPSVMNAIRLDKLQLFITFPEMDFELFNRTVPLLLQAPCTSRLRELHVDEMLAVPLMCYGVRLENVKKLKMTIHYEQLERAQPQILRIVKDFDFTRIFPNLNEVCISSGRYDTDILPHQINAVVEQANAVLREPKLDRASNIKELNLYQGSISSETAPFLAEMFPNIQKLWILAAEFEEIPYGSIWKHLINLKELEIEQRGYRISNLDSVFCGIFPEEVAELRQMDEEHLKSVNIVPVMPAITCLKNLKTLKFMRPGLGYGFWLNDDDDDDDGTMVFSKVTDFTAFQRCPSLEVSIDMRPPATGLYRIRPADISIGFTL